MASTNTAADIQINIDESSSLNADQSPQSNQAPDSPSCYEDVYRTGNFGVTLGKIDIPLGKKWVIALGIRTAVLLVFTLAGSIILSSHYSIALFRDLTIALSWTSAMQGVLVTLCGAYFFWRLPTMGHPYAWLMVLRYLAVFQFCINCCFGWLFACFVVGTRNLAVFVGLSGSEIGFVKAIYAFVIILQIDEMILCWGFFLPPHYADICDCCHAWCIYSKGEEIAPGVPDPPSQVKMMRFARAMKQVNNVIDEVAG